VDPHHCKTSKAYAAVRILRSTVWPNLTHADPAGGRKRTGIVAQLKHILSAVRSSLAVLGGGWKMGLWITSCSMPRGYGIQYPGENPGTGLHQSEQASNRKARRQRFPSPSATYRATLPIKCIDGNEHPGPTQWRSTNGVRRPGK